MNLQKQIDYWKDSPFQDIETADYLFEKSKFKESLFFCHLSIEKILKANFVKSNNDFAPKSHNLILLANKSNIIIDYKFDDLLGILMTYQLEGRYPDYEPQIPTKTEIQNYILLTKELLSWLNSQS